MIDTMLKRTAGAKDKTVKRTRSMNKATQQARRDKVLTVTNEITAYGRHFNDLSELEQMQCAHDYFMCGSLKDVAFKHNVIHKEMFDAASQQWWQMEVGHLHRESSLRMKSKLTTIMNLTLDQLEDRLKNGDVLFDKNGESYRCPTSAQSLATIANVIFDKKIKLEDRSSGIIEGENKRLIDLANSLTFLVVKEAEVIKDATSNEDTNDGA